ncbi:hypothetical protein ACFLTV_03295, partial [Chloroflexota bacterium]
QNVNLAVGVGPAYELTITISPSRGGTVEKAPDLSTYGEDMEVTLTARAASGYDFSEWSGDVSGSNSKKTVIMDGDKSVTANFVKEEAQSEGENQEPSSEAETPSSSPPTEPSPTLTSPSSTQEESSPTQAESSPKQGDPSPTQAEPSPKTKTTSQKSTSENPERIAPALFLAILVAGVIIVIVLIILIVRTKRPI